MMISLIVVALVGVGFTRLTMLALELRDNYEGDGEFPVDMGRKRVDAHNRMVSMAKPDKMVLKGDNRFEPVGCENKEEFSSFAMLQAIFYDSFGRTEETPNKPKDDPPVERLDAEDRTLLDPTDVCTICFEKAKNAVMLACGHGGVCYNCSIDVFVTSGHCPFCRKEISQIVTVGLGHPTNDDDGNAVVDVIGPTS